jgi:serine/threonine protein kinase
LSVPQDIHVTALSESALDSGSSVPDVAEVVVGRYRLVRPLGRGGMGQVWQAWDELLHREVAIKEVLLADSDQRAVREARAAAGLGHPGIVTVHDVVVHDGRPWIVMELVAGRSLAQVIEQVGPLPVREAARIGLRVLDALEVAHRQGILHRDVKPANILLDGDRVVLTDFGIAVIQDDTALTATNQVVGSPDYIAPERISGADAGPAIDLWALGVTLYLAVAGRSPFDRDDRQATFAAVLTSEPDPLPQAGPLWPVIAGLLRKDPAQRLTADRTAELLATVFAESVAPETGPQPAPAAPTDRSTRPLPRRTGRQAAILVVLVLLAATAGWAIWRQADTSADQGGQAGDATTRPPMTTSTTAPPVSSTTRPPAPVAPPGFQTKQDSRGFSVIVPDGWVTRSSQSWANYDGSQPGSLLELTVGLAEAGPEHAALPYLSRVEKIRAADALGYRLVNLTGLPSPGNGYTAAEWEYTTARPKYLRWGYDRNRVRAVVAGTGQVYQLTFSVQADFPQTLVRDWDKAQPMLTTILQNFRITA